MLRPSGTVEGELANPARAGRQQRQSVLLCRGSLAYFILASGVTFRRTTEGLFEFALFPRRPKNEASTACNP